MKKLFPTGTRPRRGYIAGPMRGLPGLNFPAFDKAADRGRALGHYIVNPADLDRAASVEEVPGHNYSPAEIRGFVLRDTTALLSLRAEHGDFIALLPGWWESKGARAEYFLAVWLGLAVLCGETFHPLDVRLPQATPGQIVQPPLMDNFRELCKVGCGLD